MSSRATNLMPKCKFAFSEIRSVKINLTPLKTLRNWSPIDCPWRVIVFLILIKTSTQTKAKIRKDEWWMGHWKVSPGMNLFCAHRKNLWHCLWWYNTDQRVDEERFRMLSKWESICLIFMTETIWRNPIKNMMEELSILWSWNEFPESPDGLFHSLKDFPFLCHKKPSDKDKKEDLQALISRKDLLPGSIKPFWI